MTLPSRSSGQLRSSDFLTLEAFVIAGMERTGLIREINGAVQDVVTLPHAKERIIGLGLDIHDGILRLGTATASYARQRRIIDASPRDVHAQRLYERQGKVASGMLYGGAGLLAISTLNDDPFNALAWGMGITGLVFDRWNDSTVNALFLRRLARESKGRQLQREAYADSVKSLTDVYRETMHLAVHRQAFTQADPQMAGELDYLGHCCALALTPDKLVTLPVAYYSPLPPVMNDLIPPLEGARVEPLGVGAVSK